MLFVLLLLTQISGETHEKIPGGTTHIVHIQDWHWVSKENYGLGQRLEGEKLDKAYERFLSEVKAVQASQRDLLKANEAVYVEGWPQARWWPSKKY